MVCHMSWSTSQSFLLRTSSHLGHRTLSRQQQWVKHLTMVGKQEALPVIYLKVSMAWHRIRHTLPTGLWMMTSWKRGSNSLVIVGRCAMETISFKYQPSSRKTARKGRAKNLFWNTTWLRNSSRYLTTMARSLCQSTRLGYSFCSIRIWEVKSLGKTL